MKLLIVFLLGLSASLAFPFHNNPKPNSLPGIVRGDIVLTPEQNEYFFGKGESRTGLTEEWFRWPGNIVPYAFDGQTQAQRDLILESVAEMEEHLCITFVERTDEVDFVQFVNDGTGCWSWVGRIGGMQQMGLDDDCYHKVVIQHEFIHALGFWHMHQAFDRDNYVRVNWENIIPGMEHNFDKVNPDTTSQFELQYDYFSIMHYPDWAFAIHPAFPTLTSVKPSISLDYRWVMTDVDIARINRMHGCPSA